MRGSSLPAVLAGVATVTLLVVAGCTSSPLATNTHSPSVSAAPTADVPVSIVVRGNGLQVDGASGHVIETIPLSDGFESITAALAKLLGPAALTTGVASYCDSTLPRFAEWGNALRLSEFSSDDVSVFVSGSSYAGLPLQTVGGLTVGSPASELSGRVPGLESWESSSMNASVSWYDLTPVPNTVKRDGVMVTSEAGFGPIASIVTPATYFSNPDGGPDYDDCGNPVVTP